jgi:RNA polymerase sigma factor (sigma-70 family)
MSTDSKDRLPLSEIIDTCFEQTRLFRETGQSDSSYCYELFRRALVTGDDAAFDALYRFYKPMLIRWALSHSLLRTQLEAEDFAQNTFWSMLKYLSGDSFSEKVTSLAEILVYLRKTMNTTILNTYRKTRYEEAEIDEQTNSPALVHNDDETRSDIWKRICLLCPEADDRLLLLCRYIYDMKPQEIAEKYLDRWKDAREVSIRLYALRKKLVQDDVLRDWAEYEPIQES